MTSSYSENSPLFEVSATVQIGATPYEVYDVISDLKRSKEWSEECVGGEWVSGEPATVGAVFRGENTREPDVVAWAPVVRGTWFTDSEVVAAEPGRLFSWAIRNSAGNKQESIWGFEIRPVEAGSELVHNFRMGSPTEGILEITADMTTEEREKFIEEWSQKLKQDISATAGRIKNVIESA
ncbi:SRPBCC family protein [Streptomyces tailanensis]|uniref:SRPBCC family protein n=1 Tax=Streptomyces tailanensis TaxID=2569858 RepID=UPI00122DE76F|nr:SRPBCC family protein [Streptomyces tailanensis]